MLETLALVLAALAAFTAGVGLGLPSSCRERFQARLHAAAGTRRERRRSGWGRAPAAAMLPRPLFRSLLARRRRLIARAFPDALDLLLICVQSGLPIEAALHRVARDCADHPLAREFAVTCAELAYLPSRQRAYGNLGSRTGLAEVRRVAAAMAQAERYGTPIGEALAGAAREGRVLRLAEAERHVTALPAKLTVPMVLFFLPVLLAVILGPALLEVMRP